MVRQVLFVQGGGADVHDRWDNKLVASLERALGDGYAVRYPRMPDEADPHYAAWRAALAGELAALDDGALVVGHSVGGTILIHALAEQPPPPRLGAIVLVAAPFIGEGGWPSDEIEARTDLAQRLPADVPIFLYHGTADEEVPVAHVHCYARALPRAVVRTLERRGHQLDDDLSDVARDLRSIT